MWSYLTPRPRKVHPPMGRINTVKTTITPGAQPLISLPLSLARVLFLTHVCLRRDVFQFLQFGLIFGSSFKVPKVLAHCHSCQMHFIVRVLLHFYIILLTRASYLTIFEC